MQTQPVPLYNFNKRGELCYDIHALVFLYSCTKTFSFLGPSHHPIYFNININIQQIVKYFQRNLARTHLTCASSHFALLYTFTVRSVDRVQIFLSVLVFLPQKLHNRSVDLSVLKQTHIYVTWYIGCAFACTWVKRLTATTALDMFYGVIAQVNSEAKHYFYTFHFISHTSRSKGSIFTPPHFISVQDESINLSLFNWASPLARSASAQEDFDPFWLDPARTQSSSSQEPLTRFGFIHIQTLPVCAMLCTSVWRRLVLTWTVCLGGSYDTY